MTGRQWWLDEYPEPTDVTLNRYELEPIKIIKLFYFLNLLHLGTATRLLGVLESQEVWILAKLQL